MTSIDILQLLLEKYLVTDLATHQRVLNLLAQIRAELNKPKPEVPKD
jgi:hypothetical protein